MGKLDKKFRWCLNKGKGDERKHKGLRKIKPDEKEAKAHIRKALHNLDAMRDFSHKYSDWSISAGFYAMYHALLAILYTMGYESRNQECTITAIEYFIKEGVLAIDLKYIEMIRSVKDMTQEEEDAKSLREEYQYGTETTISKTRLKTLTANAQDFVDKMRAVVKETE